MRGSTSIKAQPLLTRPAPKQTVTNGRQVFFNPQVATPFKKNQIGQHRAERRRVLGIVGALGDTFQ